jgi:aldehyde dehydrogenase (NAD+)
VEEHADGETFPALNSAWVTVQAPFGGVKDGGFGRECGEQGVLDFTVSKNVMIDFSDEKRDPFAVKT